MAFNDDKSFKEVSLTKRIRISVGEDGKEYIEAEAKATQWYSMGRERISMSQARDAMADCERIVDDTLRNEVVKARRANSKVEVREVSYDRFGLGGV